MPEKCTCHQRLTLASGLVCWGLRVLAEAGSPPCHVGAVPRGLLCVGDAPAASLWQPGILSLLVFLSIATRSISSTDLHASGKQYTSFKASCRKTGAQPLTYTCLSQDTTARGEVTQAHCALAATHREECLSGTCW